MSFSVIHDLGPLSDAQRQQYLRDASEFFGLDPDLNALDLIWMENGGMRRLVAYARRGTTDILRDIHQINVLSVTMQTGPGFVSFTAVGKNAKGRQEIAVGAAGTEGLKGDKLGAAVATAQTRATRRLTLQYVGGGLLDESEVSDASTTDINKLNVSLSSIATAPVQPVVAANTEAGKDVTLESRLAAGEKGIAKIPDAPDTRHAVLTQVNSVVSTQVDAVAEMPNPVPFSAGDITPAPVEEPKRKRRKKAEAIPEELGVEPTHHEPYIESAVSPNADIPESHQTPTLHPGYRITHVDEAVSVEPYTDYPGTVMELIQNSGILDVIDKIEAGEPKLFPTDDQDKAFRARLGTFTNGVLKEGGMTDGVIWRVKKYTKHLCPDVLIEENGKMKPTIAEWEKLLSTLENINKTGGPKTLVQTINEVAEKA